MAGTAWAILSVTCLLLVAGGATVLMLLFPGPPRRDGTPPGTSSPVPPPAPAAHSPEPAGSQTDVRVGDVPWAIPPEVPQVQGEGHEDVDPGGAHRQAATTARRTRQ